MFFPPYTHSKNKIMIGEFFLPYFFIFYRTLFGKMMYSILKLLYYAYLQFISNAKLNFKTKIVVNHTQYFKVTD